MQGFFVRISHIINVMQFNLIVQTGGNKNDCS